MSSRPLPREPLKKKYYLRLRLASTQMKSWMSRNSDLKNWILDAVQGITNSEISTLKLAVLAIMRKEVLAWWSPSFSGLAFCAAIPLFANWIATIVLLHWICEGEIERAELNRWTTDRPFRCGILSMKMLACLILRNEAGNGNQEAPGAKATRFLNAIFKVVFCFCVVARLLFFSSFGHLYSNWSDGMYTDIIWILIRCNMLLRRILIIKRNSF